MKISKREKILLAILGLILVGILYYQFGYQTLVSMADEKNTYEKQIEDKYNKAMKTINDIDSQKSKVKILNSKIEAEAAPLYPTISQEHIILELDKLIKESGLEGGMTFEKVEVKEVGELKKAASDTDLPESSIQAIADKYINKYGDKTKKDSENNKDDNSDSNNTSKQSPSDSTKSSSKTQNKESTVTQLQVNVDFNGRYKDVVKFLDALGKYERKMPVYTINMSTKNLNEVKGSVNLMIYSIPKIDGDLSEYLIWSLNNTYGKAEPFVIGSGVGNGIKSVKEAGDFMVSAKKMDSELPTVIMGRANDTLRTSYVYADGNSEQPAELILTQDGNKYYYKYKTLNDQMPQNYDGLGIQFVPNGENIVINAFSESRGDSDDKAGLKLKIVNKTNKLVQVDVSGEDLKAPRISIEGDSTNVSINQK